MLSPTTRTMHLTFFKVLCIDKERQCTVYKDFILYRFEWDYTKLLKYVLKNGLVKEPLIPKRVVDAKCVNEFRSMSAQFFKEHSTKVKEYYHDEKLEYKNRRSKAHRNS